MTFELRVLTVALTAFTVAGLAASLIVPRLASRIRRERAAVRARRLATLRLLPARVAAVAGLAVAIAFLVFEPRQSGEYMGRVMPALALFGAALVLAGAWRWMQIARATRRLTAEWLATAEPLELAGIGIPAFAVASRFPIVAVVGLRRPKLVIARSVLASCTPDELRAVLAHEQGHLDRRDNLRRLMMSTTPDVLAWLPASARLFADWREAAEQAADDDAARAGEDGRLHLASALVKVARLASGRPARDLMPASALYCGEGLDSRVRRLLTPARAAATTSRRRSARTLAGLAALATIVFLALEDVHAIVEVAIHALP
jgi:Zn-dependent protease with chaperone function